MISVTNLSKTYKRGKIKALNDVNFTVNEGEVLGLIGPNGAGKTTLMECMLGLIFPSSGEVQINGYNPSHIEVKKIIGFLPERAKYDSWMNAREFLGYHYMLSRQPLGGAKTAIEEALDTVQLVAEARTRPLSTYSKGMLQRVGLAQMIVGKPRLCFLDEPTSGLDPTSRNVVRDVIRSWKNEKVTVVLNSHNLDEVERVCDRVAFVYGGRIATIEKYGEAEDQFTVIVKWSGPEDAFRRLEEIGKHAELELSLAEGSSARFILSSKQQLPQLARSLVNAQIDVEEMFIEKKGLEKLFEQGWRQLNEK